MALHNRNLVLLLLLLAPLASCGKRSPEPIRVTPEDQVYYSDESRWREEARVVIRNQEEWSLWWDRLTGSLSGLPPVDFSSHMLLLYNAGRRYPGDRIQIQELMPGQEGEWIARYRIEESGVQESEVYPVQVVRVRRRGGQVRFERQLYGAP